MSQRCSQAVRLLGLYQSECRSIHSLNHRIQPPHRNHVAKAAFSSYSPLRAEEAATQAKVTKNYRLEKAKREQLRMGQIPEDLGLIENTFIMPTGKNLPAWTSSSTVRQRLLLERKRARRRFVEYAIMFGYRIGWFVQPRPQLHLKTIPDIAKDFHKSMYSHFAANTLDQIRVSLLPGLLEKLRNRVEQRPSGTVLRWKLHEHKSPPKLMSWKFMLLPRMKGQTKEQSAGLIQAVVRMHTLQSLHHIQRQMARGEGGRQVQKEVAVDAHGRVVAEKDARSDAKELVEYMVLQKSIRNSKEGPWKLWGTTEEVSVKELWEAEKKLQTEPRKGLLERLVNMARWRRGDAEKTVTS